MDPKLSDDSPFIPVERPISDVMLGRRKLLSVAAAAASIGLATGVRALGSTLRAPAGSPSPPLTFDGGGSTSWTQTEPSATHSGFGDTQVLPGGSDGKPTGTNFIPTTMVLTPTGQIGNSSWTANSVSALGTVTQIQHGDSLTKIYPGWSQASGTHTVTLSWPEGGEVSAASPLHLFGARRPALPDLERHWNQLMSRAFRSLA